jgi:ATPase
MIIVPDTSVIIDGRITKLVKKKDYKRSKVLVPEAVVAELENQANKGKESGYKGLRELNLLRKLSESGKISLEFMGKRPRRADFKDIDEIIRSTAHKAGGVLVTSDRVQSEVAKSKGIRVMYLRQRRVKKRLRVLEFFDEDTMSVHLRDKVVPMAKKGKPGEIKLVQLSEKPSRQRDLESMAKEIIEYARVDPESFIEIEREGATVVQLREVRIAIARPPFSDGYEITAVRPIADVNLEDYSLSKMLLERLRERAEGVLVAGPPGAGKSTFSQALAEFYRAQGRIVKTMESPRDLLVSEEITQYAPLEGDMEKTADILLLVRPDYTIYDEVRKTKDFKIFADMRLAGVGMVGVVHATRGIDALQRLIGRVELGMIPQIVDTVVFIKDGRIQKVYKVSFTVKVPGGMIEADLARPVIEVRDFERDEVEYEIYTFGEETVVMPSTAVTKAKKPSERLAAERVRQEIKKIAPKARVKVDLRGEKGVVQLDDKYIPKVIGRQGKIIDRLERKLGLKLEIRGFEESTSSGDEGKERLDLEVRETKNYLHLVAGKENAGKLVKVYASGEELFIATVGRRGEIKIAKKSGMAKAVIGAIAAQEELFALVE